VSISPPQQRKGRIAGWKLALSAGIVAVAIATGAFFWRVAPPRAGPQIRSIAVLPLANLSRDPEQEYFADGLTESLITELSKIGALKVISRTSVMRYKKPNKPMPQIARELGVDGLIEGSVLGEGDQVRITVQLIEGKSDHHLWAESYQREMRGVLALQSEIARDISREIRAKLSAEERARLTNTRSVDPQAHRLYLLGRYYWNKRSANGISAAIDYFQKAIAQDSAYAPAYAGLADCYAVLPTHSSAHPSDVFPKAIAAATKALEIDETLAAPHAALAYTKDVYEWDWSGAEREYKRALELNPNDANAAHWHALHLAYVGRLDEAITEITRAQELDPLSLVIATNHGMLLYFTRREDEAVTQLSNVLKMDPTFVLAHSTLGAIYDNQERYDEAIAQRKKAVELSKGVAFYALAGLGKAYARAGKRAEAEKIVEQLKQQSTREYVHPSHFAFIYLGLGEKDLAFTYLEQAYAEHSFFYVLKSDPAFDPLRSDPRFQDLLRRMGLPSDASSTPGNRPTPTSPSCSRPRRSTRSCSSSDHVRSQFRLLKSRPPSLTDL
jgi:TolB-like protein/Flp pilus assembly protein TadD